MANNTLPACDWGKLPRIPKATLPPDPYALPPGAQPFKFERGVHFTPMLPSDWGCKRTPPSELKVLLQKIDEEIDKPLNGVAYVGDCFVQTIWEATVKPASKVLKSVGKVFDSALRILLPAAGVIFLVGVIHWYPLIA